MVDYTENQQVEYKNAFGKDVIISLASRGEKPVALDSKPGGIWIREHLQTYPEDSLSLEEVADFLRVVLQVRDTTPQASEEVFRLLQVLNCPLSRQEIQDKLGLQDRKQVHPAEAYF